MYKALHKHHSGTTYMYWAVVGPTGEDYFSIGNEDYAEGSFVDLTQEDAEFFAECLNKREIAGD